MSCAAMLPSAGLVAKLRHSSHFTGMARLFPYRQAQRGFSRAHTARTRRLPGPHLGLQCHVEMTPELVRDWCKAWGKEVESLAQRAPSVQTPAQMTEDL